MTRDVILHSGERGNSASQVIFYERHVSSYSLSQSRTSHHTTYC